MSGSAAPPTGMGAGNVSVPVVIDTDPGIDDALAILLALASPELRVLGITTVGGNVGVDKTTRNALDLLALLGRTDVPVGAGASRPLVREAERNAALVHGDDGLGGAGLPRSPAGVDPRGAVGLLRDLIESTDEPVTVIAIGPLTNLALLAGTHPRTFAKIARIVLMGGGVRDRLGNVTPTAEFNIWFDPEAASRVFDGGVPITMIGLNVTTAALVHPSAWQRLHGGGPVAQAVLRMVEHYSRWYTAYTGAPDTAQHDALAVAAVVRPSLVTTRHVRVDVECAGTFTRGMTVARLDPTEFDEPVTENADVAVEVAAAQFTQLLVSRIASLDR